MRGESLSFCQSFIIFGDDQTRLGDLFPSNVGKHNFQFEFFPSSLFNFRNFRDFANEIRGEITENRKSSKSKLQEVTLYV